MITGEGIAAGAAMAAKNALGEDAVTRAALVEASKDTSGFARAAELRGRKMAAREQAVLNLFRPLYRLLGVSRDYFDGEFSEDLARKLADVPEQALVAPRTPVVMPAMQGLAWSLDEPDLKEMYLNLLAAAADGRRSDAHPAFAEIIRQLSPREAPLLNQVLIRLATDTGVGLALVSLRHRTKGKSGFREGIRHIGDITKGAGGEPVENEQLPLWIDNWVRLRLVEARYDEFVTDEGEYAFAETRPEVLRARAALDEGDELEIVRGLLKRTDFGNRFQAAVFSWPTPAPVQDQAAAEQD
jgi:hypothetical protein